MHIQLGLGALFHPNWHMEADRVDRLFISNHRRRAAQVLPSKGRLHVLHPRCRILHPPAFLEALPPSLAFYQGKTRNGNKDSTPGSCRGGHCGDIRCWLQHQGRRGAY